MHPFFDFAFLKRHRISVFRIRCLFYVSVRYFSVRMRIVRISYGLIVSEISFSFTSIAPSAGCSSRLVSSAERMDSAQVQCHFRSRILHLVQTHNHAVSVLCFLHGLKHYVAFVCRQELHAVFFCRTKNSFCPAHSDSALPVPYLPHATFLHADTRST